VIGRKERLGIRRAEIAAKVIDGEAIVINLATGLYYSLGKVGGRIWSLIERNLSSEDIAAAIASEYGVSKEMVGSDVVELVEQLAAEQLIEVASVHVAPQESRKMELNTGKAYAKPELRKFSDMAEIFAMDPPLPGLAKAAK
jgi:chemotaxis receptor (MCP) glutamine deamidase CheD